MVIGEVMSFDLVLNVVGNDRLVFNNHKIPYVDTLTVDIPIKLSARFIVTRLIDTVSRLWE